MAKRFTDKEFLAAVAETAPARGQLEKVAALVGCSAATAAKRLKALAAAGAVVAEKQHTWDKQQTAYSSAFFGGAGVCIRRFWTFKLAREDS